MTAQSRFEKNGFKLIAEHVWYELKPARYLAIFERSEGDFHAAGAEVGGLFAEYADSSNTWTVMSDSLSFTQLGSWGHAPKPSFIRLGPNAVGIMFEGGFTGQGYLSQDLRLFGIVNGKFVEVLGVPTLTGSMESTDVQAEIFQVVDSSQEIYPLRAKISYGKDPDPDFVKVFGPGPTAEFRFRNGRFERQ